MCPMPATSFARPASMPFAEIPVRRNWPMSTLCSRFADCPTLRPSRRLGLRLTLPEPFAALLVPRVEDGPPSRRRQLHENSLIHSS